MPPSFQFRRGPPRFCAERVKIGKLLACGKCLLLRVLGGTEHGMEMQEAIAGNKELVYFGNCRTQVWISLNSNPQNMFSLPVGENSCGENLDLCGVQSPRNRAPCSAVQVASINMNSEGGSSELGTRQHIYPSLRKSHAPASVVMPGPRVTKRCWVFVTKRPALMRTHEILVTCHRQGDVRTKCSGAS